MRILEIPVSLWVLSCGAPQISSKSLLELSISDFGKLG